MSAPEPIAAVLQRGALARAERCVPPDVHDRVARVRRQAGRILRAEQAALLGALVDRGDDSAVVRAEVERWARCDDWTINAAIDDATDMAIHAGYEVERCGETVIVRQYSERERESVEIDRYATREEAIPALVALADAVRQGVCA